MKKSLTIVLVIVLIALFGMTAVHAVTSFNVALSANATKVQQGKDVVVTVALKDFKQGETGINSMLLTLDYDKTVFEELAASDIQALNDWGGAVFNPANGALALDNSRFINENHDMVKVTFKVRQDAKIGSTVITAKDVNGSDTVDDIFPPNQTINLQIEKASGTSNNTTNNVTNTNTNTHTNKNTMPNTGVENFVIPAIAIIAIIAVMCYVRYTKIDK